MLESIASLRQVKPLAYVFAAIAAAFVFLLMTSSALAAPAPVITGAVTSDANHDGTVDTITVSFSPNAQINDTLGAANGLDSITIDGGCTGIVNGNYASPGTATLVLTVSGCVGSNTSVTPTVTYTAVADCATEFAICNTDASAQLVGLTPNATATDGAAPILLSAVLGSATGSVSGVLLNRLTFTYTENMTVNNGPSSANVGALTTAGTVTGLATFSTGNGADGAVVQNPSMNTVAGNTTAIITVDFVDGGDFFASASATAPGGTVTPISTNFVTQSAAGSDRQVYAGTTVTASGDWDLVKPTISSITLADNAGPNGRIDRATIVFSHPVRDAGFANADALLTDSALTTHAGTWDGAANNDATKIFDVASDNAVIDTSATAAQFTYTNTSGSFITDLAGNLLDSAGDACDVTDGCIAAADSVEVDGAKPQIKTFTYEDTDLDGKIDHILLTFSESVVGGSVLGASDLTLTNVGDFTSLAFGAGADLISSTVAFVDVTMGTEASAVDTKENSTNIAISSQTAFSLVDSTGNTNNTLGAQAGNATFVDGAKPILVSTSPVNAAVSVSKTAVVTLTFSEILTTMTFSVVGQAVADYTKSLTAAAVTLTPVGAMAGGYHAITVATAVDAIGNTYGGVTGAAVNPFTFTVISSSSTEPTVASYTMLVTAPNGGEALVDGTTKNITWSSSQTNSSAMNNVNISYTTDGGVTYHAIANNETNDGTYSWTVPSIDAGQVFIKVVGTDLVIELASDSSDTAFSIATTVITAPASGTTGVSPVTGLTEDISVVAFGNYIKSPFYDTVYYVDYATDGSTLIRRPFNDHQTFMTYQANFNSVITVTDATLPTLSLSTPMMPRPGVVLVKITTVNKVYAIGTSGELRWVTSEELASSIYGSNWSNYVIDIPDTLYPSFTHGTDIVTDENIDVSGMKTRAEVNS
ncbi:TPA: hypothetical protein DEP96_03570 [Candidatus Uhrbacteria bacterium]|nr:hypothetical protein [Candidatus Uhrbacteria bacterium]